MDQMTVVGLATDCGKIVPKDLWAHRLFARITAWKVQHCIALQHFFHARIRMASQQGDIICEGTIEGDVIAETQGEGDFKARWLSSSPTTSQSRWTLSHRVVFGPRLKVKTVAGDILLTEECFSEVSIRKYEWFFVPPWWTTLTCRGQFPIRFWNCTPTQATFTSENTLARQPVLSRRRWGDYLQFVNQRIKAIYRGTCSMFSETAVWTQLSKKEMWTWGEASNWIRTFGQIFLHTILNSDILAESSTCWRTRHLRWENFVMGKDNYSYIQRWRAGAFI